MSASFPEGSGSPTPGIPRANLPQVGGTAGGRRDAAASNQSHGEAASELVYVKQRPGDLVYWLFEGPAPREFVKVVLQRRVSVSGGEAVLAIIGSSHFLELRTGGTVVTEMLASARPGLDRLLIARGLRNGRGGARLVHEELDYRFQLEETSLSPADFERESRRLTADAADRIVYSFPSGEGETSAVTCLDWQLDGRNLVLDTYHTFPGESTIVRSRTVVGFPEGGGTP